MERIWNFSSNEAVETEKVEMKQFKPTGRFFDDIQTLAKMFNIRVHPSLTEKAYKSENPDADDNIKDLTTLSFMKHRLDRNTIRAMFLALPPAQHIQTLK